MTGIGQLTRGAFIIDDFLRNPHLGTVLQWGTHSKWDLVGDSGVSPGLENAVKRWCCSSLSRRHIRLICLLTSELVKNVLDLEYGGSAKWWYLQLEPISHVSCTQLHFTHVLDIFLKNCFGLTAFSQFKTETG